MAGKKQPAPEGAPLWIVTFADLMSLLVCFFVLIISFSIQDKEKLQVVAGSIREAFGVKRESRVNAVIEFDGYPVRKHQRRSGLVETPLDTDFENFRHDQRRRQGPEADTHDHKQTTISKPRSFALAAESLRQAWQELPDIAEISKNIIVEEIEEGLNIKLVDQEGRAMFPSGSSIPNSRARQILQKMAHVISEMPNQITITGHTDRSGYPTAATNRSWDLSLRRADAIRRVLQQSGVANSKFSSVSGKADTDPIIPEAPELSVNRRVEILLIREEPPLPKKRLF